jgi:hypothetical protein
MVRRCPCRNLLQTTRRNVTSKFALNRGKKSTKEVRRLLKKLVYLRVVPSFCPLKVTNNIFRHRPTIDNALTRNAHCTHTRTPLLE